MAQPDDFLHPRDGIMRTMERIYRYRMTTTSGGNLSIREDNDDIWITPGGVDKGQLRREDIVRVDAGGAIEGLHKASSELPFHKAIYRSTPEVRAIVHAHPVALVAFSVSGQVPDTRLFHQARRVCGEAGFAPYGLPGSDDLAQKIARSFQSGSRCVVLENHGVVVGGDTLQNAFHRFETLEFVAKTIVKARLLGEIRYLTDDEIRLPDRIPPLPEFERSSPTSREKERRRELCQFIRRGYQQRLLVSTQGSFSARLDSESFIITPSQLDRSTVEADHLVLVCRNAVEAGRIPSRASAAHSAIYRRYPDINAIANADPVNATAFGVSPAILDPRLIPESFVVLRDIVRIPYGMQFTAPEQLAQELSLNRPVALLENDGVLVVGRNVLEAFDRLEVLESTAEALINGHILGGVVPMPSAVIEQLTQAFLLKD